jgi:serine/threonine kinase 16
VELVEEAQTHSMYALKRIACHSTEDQRIAMNEVESHKSVEHPGVIEMIDYDLKAKIDPLEDLSSELLILLPYYNVSFKIIKELLKPMLSRYAN